MAVTFLEPSGDADFANGIGASNNFWGTGFGTTATDFVHGSHVKSIAYATTGSSALGSKTFVLNATGNRISVYFYINVLPNATAPILAASDGGVGGVMVKLTSAGKLQLARWDTEAQIGSDGSTLSTGIWYRISMAYTITSTTVNEIRVFKDGILDISVTNATIGGASVSTMYVGNLDTNAALDLRSSDHYIDNSNSLTDTGNIWVTAKRPVSNGTTNGFTTQIGSGGSGYGSGHTPQVNERPKSSTNGWSMVGAGSTVTEEYNVEAKNVGDIDISTATIIDWVGWASMKSLAGETLNMILDGANVTQAITSTTTLYTKIKGSTTYPSGTGADIGITTTTALTTVSLYECGVIVAYIPSPTTNSGFLAFM